MKENPLRLSLLDYLGYRMGCVSLSDLHTLDRGRKLRLLHEVERLGPEDASLHEWNDALAYLTGQPPERDAESAREKNTVVPEMSESRPPPIDVPPAPCGRAPRGGSQRETASSTIHGSKRSRFFVCLTTI